MNSIGNNQYSFAHPVFGKDVDLIGFVLNPAPIANAAEAWVLHYIGFCGLNKSPQAGASLECSRGLTGKNAGVKFEPSKAHPVRQHVMKNAHHPSVAG